MSNIGISSREMDKFSCLACRSRKVKCDKAEPCGTCMRTGSLCVFPSLPRPVNDKKRPPAKSLDPKLEEVTDRLERLVGSVVAQAVSSDKSTPVKPPYDETGGCLDRPYQVNHNEAGTCGRALVSPYWGSRFFEILDDITQCLPESEQSILAEEGEESEPATRPGQLGWGDDLVFRKQSIEPLPLSDKQQISLFNYYFRNFHSVCRILHRPTITIALLDNIPVPGLVQYTDRTNIHLDLRAKNALLHSIYYAAVTTMSSTNCLDALGESQEKLLRRFRQNAQSALSEVDFLNNADMIVLQAFTIYLTAAWAHSPCQANWTLISVAVRLAQALELHKDGDGCSFSVFEAELRRRLWWQILVLDIRSSELQGTEPVVLGKRFNTRMPLNVQDVDFGPHSRRLPVERHGSSDASIPLLHINAYATLLRLDLLTLDDIYPVTKIELEQLVDQCVARISQYSNTTTITLGRSLSMPAESIIAQLLIHQLRLRVKYPIEAAKELFSSEGERDEGLNHAVAYLELLEKLQTAIDFEHLAWWFRYMIPWHALAVTLLELCNRLDGDLFRRAWVVIDKTILTRRRKVRFINHQTRWSLIEKLHQNAVTVKKGVPHHTTG